MYTHVYTYIHMVVLLVKSSRIWIQRPIELGKCHEGLASELPCLLQRLHNEYDTQYLESSTGSVRLLRDPPMREDHTKEQEDHAGEPRWESSVFVCVCICLSMPVYGYGYGYGYG